MTDRNGKELRIGDRVTWVEGTAGFGPGFSLTRSYKNGEVRIAHDNGTHDFVVRPHELEVTE